MWPNQQEIVVWSHLLKKFLMENFIFCAVKIPIMFHETFILDSNVFVYILKLGKEKLFKINQKISNIKFQ